MTLPSITVARTQPKTADAVGVAVAQDGAVPRSLGLNRAALSAIGFDGKPGQVLVVPGTPLIAVGVGASGPVAVNTLRTAAAVLARAAAKRDHLTTNLADLGADAKAAGQAVAEGVLLGSYRYTAMRSKPEEVTPKLAQITLVAPQAKTQAVAAGVDRGVVTAYATALARDLANTPPGYMTARDIAAKAVEVGPAAGLQVEVFNRDQLEAMGCGGIVGVNAGSKEPPRMVKLTYSPRNPVGHLAMVGKGVMYDSGGISLKPSDGMHVLMKLDMSGAAAVLGAMTALKGLRCRSKVTAYLMCTDNLPSGSAMKLGDVLTFRNGKTAEIHNTDAEGRLVLADGLSLAVEEHPDAVVDIATLTGACVVALGQKIGGLVSNNQALADEVLAAGRAADESLWQMPLATEYRKLLDSNVADLKNVGGPYGGVITSSLFLKEFVGDTPWAHLDIAGPMHADGDDGWLARGATAFGTRTLIELAIGFTGAKPA
jgi:leucyl aminopeptidase